MPGIGSKKQNEPTKRETGQLVPTRTKGNTMRRSNIQLLLTLLAVVASGCTTMGTGSGSTPSGGHPTVFNWKSSDGISGRIGVSGWDYWGAYPSPDFVTHYSGRVVAHLAAPNGTHIRCQFRLMHPADGMNGGGIGQCQLPDGTTIDANFPTA
jgi:hypothetical protein